VGCRIVPFYEIGQKYSLKEHRALTKFPYNRTNFAELSQRESMQCDVMSAFFCLPKIQKAGTLFDIKTRNYGEDTLFICRLFCTLNVKGVLNCYDSIFFYRARQAQDSVTAAFPSDDYFLELPRCWLRLLLDVKATDEKKEKGSTLFLEHAVIWYAVLFFRRGTRDVDLEGCNPSVVDEGIRHMQELLSHIDARTIEYCCTGDMWEFDKVRMLAIGKHQEVSYEMTLYLQGIDIKRSEMLCYAYVMEDVQFSFYFDEQSIAPLYYKIVALKCWNHVCWKQIRFIIPYHQEVRFMTVRFRNILCDIYDKHHKKRYGLFPISAIVRECKNDEIDPDLWLLTDRSERADDNAEHLYRYIRAHYPGRKIKFALHRSSCHWQRLANEGFQLISIGSKKYKIAHEKASRIISSSLEANVVEPYDKTRYVRKFVFLQHGVIRDDTSSYLNNKKIDLMITSTPEEAASIKAQNSPYQLFPHQVKMTGLARHDALLRKMKSTTTKTFRSILVMPTWRVNIIGKWQERGGGFEYKKTFYQSAYALTWKSFLSNDRLKALAQTYGYRIVFSPHANILPYLKIWNLPKYVVCEDCKKKSIQELFAENDLVITDYSSIAFEIAYIKKPIIYYQFDKEHYFSSDASVSRVGYFDYHRDGFGPVSTTEEDLWVELEGLLKRECQPTPQYLQRMETTFPFRDGQCCERIYQAICNLDKKGEPV
jgi:CDP-glycerol glycerophosphotransferase (TagB/SpsB family)